MVNKSYTAHRRGRKRKHPGYNISSPLLHKGALIRKKKISSPESLIYMVALKGHSSFHRLIKLRERDNSPSEKVLKLGP